MQSADSLRDSFQLLSGGNGRSSQARVGAWLRPLGMSWRRSTSIGEHPPFTCSYLSMLLRIKYSRHSADCLRLFAREAGLCAASSKLIPVSTFAYTNPRSRAIRKVSLRYAFSPTV